jgi:hypothetical protein
MSLKDHQYISECLKLGKRISFFIQPDARILQQFLQSPIQTQSKQIISLTETISRAYRKQMKVRNTTANMKLSKEKVKKVQNRQINFAQ